MRIKLLVLFICMSFAMHSHAQSTWTKQKEQLEERQQDLQIKRDEYSAYVQKVNDYEKNMNKQLQRKEITRAQYDEWLIRVRSDQQKYSADVKKLDGQLRETAKQIQRVDSYIDDKPTARPPQVVQKRLLDSRKETRWNHGGGGTYTVTIKKYKIIYDNGASETVEEE